MLFTPRPCIFAAVVITTSTCAAAQDLSPSETLEDLVATTELESGASFEDFLNGLDPDAVDGLAEAREALGAGELSQDQLALLGRLLGVYNRVANADAALELLSDLVAMETYADSESPDQTANPAFVSLGEKVASVAEDFDLTYRNIADRIFEVTLDGPGEDVFGILTHADVVPVQSQTWTTEDGTEIDPFKMEIIGNRIYGRGTIDDKGSIVTALFAMRTVKDSGLPLMRDIRLMIETTEETTGAGMEYYLENETAPDYNIVLDSDYPAVVAEKGYGTITASFALSEDEADGPAIASISGSAAANQIPETASAEIATDDAASVAQTLSEATEEYVSENGDDFSIDVSEGDGSVTVTITGVSAHASEPEGGVNPVPRLTGFLTQGGIDLAPNAYLSAAEYVNGAYGLDYEAKSLGVGYSDVFMGPLTLSPTFFQETDGAVDMKVNVRAPRHPDLDVGGVKEEISSALSDWKSQSGSDANFDVELADWMYRDPNAAWIDLLLDVYGGTTGKTAEPVSTAGSTTAKLLPRAVNFGPNMPEDKYMGHTENEFKRLDVFHLDLQMFTEMMVRMSNLETLE